MADGDGLGDTSTMASLPPATLYHRWMGWHASSIRRAVVVACIGLLVASVLVWLVSWELAVIAGWDAAAFSFLLSVWPIIIGAGSSHAAQLATREDESRGSAGLLLVGASVASLLGAGFVLNLAGQDSGPSRVPLIEVAVLTVVLSWTVVNTVYTLRYADLHYRSRGVAIALGEAASPEGPTYRDFAYVAFTIGMTYQVSDTTVGNPEFRHTVLVHAFLSYLFGVVIVGVRSTSSPDCSADPPACARKRGRAITSPHSNIAAALRHHARDPH
jgi:uncharacterized membrane protein